MRNTTWPDRISSFMLGALTILALLFLTGAAPQSPIGRYQISSWVRGQFVGAMVVDTTTGTVKYVDSKSEGIPFTEIP